MEETWLTCITAISSRIPNLPRKSLQTLERKQILPAVLDGHVIKMHAQPINRRAVQVELIHVVLCEEHRTGSSIDEEIALASR